jgi:hypothetical protein
MSPSLQLIARVLKVFPPCRRVKFEQRASCTDEYRHRKYQQRLAGSLMIALSDKTVALYGVFCLLLMPCSAHAGV